MDPRRRQIRNNGRFYSILRSGILRYIMGIYMDEGQLQKIYYCPGGTAWNLFLHVLGIKSMPTPPERIKKGYESYIASSVFNDKRVRVLRKYKDIFFSNFNSYGKIYTSTIFGIPVYEGIIGDFDSVNELFDNKLRSLKRNGASLLPEKGSINSK